MHCRQFSSRSSQLGWRITCAGLSLKWRHVGHHFMAAARNSPYADARLSDTCGGALSPVTRQAQQSIPSVSPSNLCRQGSCHPDWHPLQQRRWAVCFRSTVSSACPSPYPAGPGAGPELLGPPVTAHTPFEPLWCSPISGDDEGIGHRVDSNILKMVK